MIPKFSDKEQGITLCKTTFSVTKNANQLIKRHKNMWTKIIWIYPKQLSTVIFGYNQWNIIELRANKNWKNVNSLEVNFLKVLAGKSNDSFKKNRQSKFCFHYLCEFLFSSRHLFFRKNFVEAMRSRSKLPWNQLVTLLVKASIWREKCWFFRKTQYSVEKYYKTRSYSKISVKST